MKKKFYYNFSSFNKNARSIEIVFVPFMLLGHNEKERYYINRFSKSINLKPPAQNWVIGKDFLCEIEANFFTRSDKRISWKIDSVNYPIRIYHKNQSGRFDIVREGSYPERFFTEKEGCFYDIIEAIVDSKLHTVLYENKLNKFLSEILGHGKRSDHAPDLMESKLSAHSVVSEEEENLDGQNYKNKSQGIIIPCGDMFL